MRIREPKAPAHRSIELLLLSAWLLIPDRKSTRLNSSHDQISYAVFCLKKKKKNNNNKSNSTHSSHNHKTKAPHFRDWRHLISLLPGYNYTNQRYIDLAKLTQRIQCR